MDKSIKESIDNFEHKKEFREVKLKTRQSFREDQVALERRLSKRTDGRTHKVNMTNEDTKVDRNGNENNGVPSKLESIVLDIGIEKEKERERETSTNGVSVTVNEENGPQKVSVEKSVYIDKEENSQKESGDKNKKSFTNGQSETSKVSHQNGYIVQLGSNKSNGLVPNGHAVEQNGQSTGLTTLVKRPKVAVQPRTAMTPEPRLKSLKGIYQKNPKLTATSTEHLDNVSLKGVRVSGSTHGQKTEYQQVTVPVIPGAEVTSIPVDGNLGEFTVEQMVTMFRHFRLPEELVYRLNKCKVDGKRFSVFTDSELSDLGMNNPIIRYFRDRTAQKQKKKPPKFML